MAAVGILALAWWGVSWITILLLACGLGCLAAVVSAWLGARRTDKLLNNVHRAPDKEN